MLNSKDEIIKLTKPFDINSGILRAKYNGLTIKAKLLTHTEVTTEFINDLNGTLSTGIDQLTIAHKVDSKSQLLFHFNGEMTTCDELEYEDEYDVTEKISAFYINELYLAEQDKIKQFIDAKNKVKGVGFELINTNKSKSKRQQEKQALKALLIITLPPLIYGQLTNNIIELILDNYSKAIPH